MSRACRYLGGLADADHRGGRGGDLHLTAAFIAVLATDRIQPSDPTVPAVRAIQGTRFRSRDARRVTKSSLDA